MKTINIMTSSDGNLMKFIPIQLESISVNLTDKIVNFYLFHDGKNMDYIDKLKKIEYINIKFHDIVVEEAPVYELIAARGGGVDGVEPHITASALISICQKI